MSKKLIFKKFKALFSCEKSGFSSLVGALMMALASGNLMAMESTTTPSGTDGFVKKNATPWQKTGEKPTYINGFRRETFNYTGNNHDIKNYAVNIFYPKEYAEDFTHPLLFSSECSNDVIAKILVCVENNKKDMYIKKDKYTNDTYFYMDNYFHSPLYIFDEADSEFSQTNNFFSCLFSCKKPILSAYQQPITITTKDWILEIDNILNNRVFYKGMDDDFKKIISERGAKFSFTSQISKLSDITDDASRITNSRGLEFLTVIDADCIEIIKSFIVNNKYSTTIKLFPTGAQNHYFEVQTTNPQKIPEPEK